VLITEPIENLDIKGTFMDQGYYYFRNGTEYYWVVVGI
jgi:hypothetical protein